MSSETHTAEELLEQCLELLEDLPTNPLGMFQHAKLADMIIKLKKHFKRYATKQ